MSRQFREEKILLTDTRRELPGDPVVRTPSFHCCGPGFSSGQGTKIPQAVWCGHK